MANADDTSTIEPPVDMAASVVRVGDGRGFIVTGNDDRKLVITAGHCLPFVPPCINFSGLSERTYRRLIGPIGQEPTISAECMFVDSISDLAVLGPPDDQDLSEECDAYEAFVEPLVGLSIADVLCTPLLVDGRQPEGAKGWVLSLAGEWQTCRMSHFGGPLWLSGAKIKGGMSGSPILSANGSAVGLIASNYAQPRLLHSLPGWVIKAEINRRVREKASKTSPARKPAVAALSGKDKVAALAWGISNALPDAKKSAKKVVRRRRNVVAEQSAHRAPEEAPAIPHSGKRARPHDPHATKARSRRGVE